MLSTRPRRLHCLVPINVAQAALGATVDLLTFDGVQTVKIPESSQPASRLRLKGLGVPRVNASGRGDLFVLDFLESSDVRFSAPQRWLGLWYFLRGSAEKGAETEQ